MRDRHYNVLRFESLCELEHFAKSLAVFSRARGIQPGSAIGPLWTVYLLQIYSYPINILYPYS